MGSHLMGRDRALLAGLVIGLILGIVVGGRTGSIIMRVLAVALIAAGTFLALRATRSARSLTHHTMEEPAETA